MMIRFHVKTRLQNYFEVIAMNSSFERVVMIKNEKIINGKLKSELTLHENHC